MLNNLYILSSKNNNLIKNVAKKYFDSKITIVDDISTVEKQKNNGLIISSFNNIPIDLFLKIKQNKIPIISIVFSSLLKKLKIEDRKDKVFIMPSNQQYFLLKNSDIIISDILHIKILFEEKFIFDITNYNINTAEKYIINAKDNKKNKIKRIAEKLGIDKNSYFYIRDKKKVENINDGKINKLNKIKNKNTYELQFDLYTTPSDLNINIKKIYLINENDGYLNSNEKLVEKNREKIKNLLLDRNEKGIEVYKKDILLKLNFENSIEDDKEFIFIKNNRIPNLTIFIITVGGEQLYKTLKAINDLKLTCSFIINIIYKISPTSKAYGEMPKRCKTKYFLQLDEDMILYNDSLNIFQKSIADNDENNFLNIYTLHDKVLGITKEKYIWGIKLYNSIILNHFDTVDKTKNKETSSVDRHWHSKPLSYDFKIKKNHTKVGIHALYRNYFEIFLKYAKVTNNILFGIAHIDDYMRLCHILLQFNSEIFLGAIKKIASLYNKSADNKFKNDIFQNLITSVIVTSLNNSSDFNKKYLAHKSYLNKYYTALAKNDMINISSEELFVNYKTSAVALSGIIFASTGGYKYNYELYPIDLFNNIFSKYPLTRNILIISSQMPNYGGSSTNALSFHNYLLSNFVNSKMIILDEDKMLNNVNENIIFYDYSPNIAVIKKSYFKNNIKNLNILVKKLWDFDPEIIIIRNPQSKYLSKYNFKETFIDKKIISFIGGGIRITDEENRLVPFSNFDLNNIKEEDEKYIQSSLKRSINYSDYFMSNSREISKFLNFFCKEKNLGYIISSSINKFDSIKIFDKMNFEESWEDRFIDILFICSNTVRTVKNIDKILEIFSKDELISYNKVIIGKNIDKLENVPSNKNINLYEFTADDLDEIYKNTKLVINTSFYDSSPNTIFEGIYFGSNVLINKNVGNNFLFNKECVVENYNDIEEWIKKIVNLLKNYEYPFRNKEIPNKIEKNVESVLRIFDNIVINKSETKHIILDNL